MYARSPLLFIALNGKLMCRHPAACSLNWSPQPAERGSPVLTGHKQQHGRRRANTPSTRHTASIPRQLVLEANPLGKPSTAGAQEDGLPASRHGSTVVGKHLGDRVRVRWLRKDMRFCREFRGESRRRPARGDTVEDAGEKKATREHSFKVQGVSAMRIRCM